MKNIRRFLILFSSMMAAVCLMTGCTNGSDQPEFLFGKEGGAPEIAWTRVYGPEKKGCSLTSAKKVAALKDGGCAVLGNKFPGGWLLRLDGKGDTLWTRTFNDGGIGNLDGICETGDGCLVVAGALRAGEKGVWARLLKTDRHGTILWEQSYRDNEGNDDLRCRALEPTDDGGYMLLIDVEEPGRLPLLLKTDDAGNETWRNELTGEGMLSAAVVRQTPDKGYVVAGTRRLFRKGRHGMEPGMAVQIKTDPQGKMIWERRYGGDNADYFRDAAITGDGGMILTGSTRSLARDGIDCLWLVKTGADGQMIWQKVIEKGERKMTGGSAVRKTVTGDGYVVCGHYTGRGWIVRTDTDGNKTWECTVRNAGPFYGLAAAPDGRYTAVGKWAVPGEITKHTRCF